MENKKCITNILAILSFVLLILTATLNLYSASSSNFIQTYFILVVIGLLILTIFINKEKQEMLSVTTATATYFVYVLTRSLIYVIDRVVAFFQNLVLSSMREKLQDMDYGEEYINLYDKIENLSNTISKDTFGEILDIICLIITIAFIVVAVVSIINILLKKDFSKTMLGKITNKIMSKSQKSSQNVLETLDTQQTEQIQGDNKEEQTEQVQNDNKEEKTEQTDLNEETQNQE
ncbi:MAG: ABC transporter ATP-binding protein [Clostridia bacterium]|nr:ABC transporter ATP-binding protein [Clostridia bacterium]